MLILVLLQYELRHQFDIFIKALKGEHPAYELLQRWQRFQLIQSILDITKSY